MPKYFSEWFWANLAFCALVLFWMIMLSIRESVITLGSYSGPWAWFGSVRFKRVQTEPFTIFETWTKPNQTTKLLNRTVETVKPRFRGSVRFADCYDSSWVVVSELITTENNSRCVDGEEFQYQVPFKHVNPIVTNLAMFHFDFATMHPIVPLRSRCSCLFSSII